MKISVLLGNGFDLNLGLRTSYMHFRDYYMEQDNDEFPFIKEYKEKFGSNYKFWSDLEKGLGEYASKFSEDNEGIKQYQEFYNDMVMSLCDYLRNEEKQSDISFSGALLNRFIGNILCFYLFLQEIEKKRIKYEKPLDGNPAEVNLLVFNYTDTIDRILHYSSDTTENILLPDKEDHCLANIKMIHMHGTCYNSLIFGFSDENQIHNNAIKSNTDIKNSMIKPKANDLLQNDHESFFLSSINNADYILIYGMSLGETDSNRWKSIIKNMIEHNNTKVIIFEKGNKYDLVLSTRLPRKRENVRKKFLSYYNMDEKTLNDVSARVTVAISSKIFDKLYND